MSLINKLSKVQELAKVYNLATLTAEWSGVLFVCLDNVTGSTGGKGNIYDNVIYNIDNNTLKVVTPNLTYPAYALPGFLAEGQASFRLNSYTYPISSSSDIAQQYINTNESLVVTTLPKYWYPTIPEGEQLSSYLLRARPTGTYNFGIVDCKNNIAYVGDRMTTDVEGGVLTIKIDRTNISTSVINLFYYSTDF